MVSVWISQENALVQNLAPNGTFFAWEMIKKTHHQHKSIKFNFDFTKSFEYSDEWPTNPGISDTPEMYRAKGFLMPLQRCPFLAAIARRKGEWQGYTTAEVRVCHIIDHYTPSGKKGSRVEPSLGRAKALLRDFRLFKCRLNKIASAVRR
jgi:hypothetical protein